MERIRVNDCARLYTLRRGLDKLARDLVEAVERTPPTVSSRHLLEESQRLAYSMVVLARQLEKSLDCA
ncbi:MAG: hypothetical protein F7C38_07200 [Desulfurococcales archaeon]|nr:hypothetical protein [Desulfurococcales archaeon]MEB3807140.1 hypothetical protein [Desulfurococcales archaeon]